RLSTWHRRARLLSCEIIEPSGAPRTKGFDGGSDETSRNPATSHHQHPMNLLETHMKKMLMLLALLSFFSAAGCSSDAPPPKDNNSVATNHGDIQVPEWFLAIPSEPGKAFYGSGTGTFVNAAVMQNGVNAADANARKQIAETMQTKIQSL